MTDTDHALSMPDRILRALFVALAVGLAWGIRGDFGGQLGAMSPGACLGLGFAYVMGQRSAFKWMPIFGAVSAIAISTGGMMSYGLLHGYAKADTLPNYAYGFFTLFIQGGAWGVFGCALLGLLLERKPFSVLNLASLVITLVVAGFLTNLIVLDWIGFDINPGRGNTAVTFNGAAVGLFIWLAVNKYWVGLRGAMFGYIGFGLGMSGGRLLANASYALPFSINAWNVGETTAGFVGAFIFTWAMVGRRAPAYAENRNFAWVSAWSAVCAVALVPLLHRLQRTAADEKIPQWTESLTEWGYDNAEAIAQGVMANLNYAVIASFVLALFFIIAWARNFQRFGPLPVIGLCFIMIVFQLQNALHFYRERDANYWDMHYTMWIMFAIMVVLAAVWEFTGQLRKTTPDDDDVTERVPWKVWVPVAVAAYLVIIGLAGFTNGEETMKSANTLWPEWSWRDGEPFPGRE